MDKEHRIEKIDALANRSGLKKWNASGKLFCILICMLLCIGFSDIFLSLWFIFSAALINIFVSGAGWRNYGKLCLAPLGILFLGFIAMAVELSLSGGGVSQAEQSLLYRSNADHAEGICLHQPVFPADSLHSGKRAHPCAQAASCSRSDLQHDVFDLPIYFYLEQKL